MPRHLSFPHLSVFLLVAAAAAASCEWDVYQPRDIPVGEGGAGGGGGMGGGGGGGGDGGAIPEDCGGVAMLADPFEAELDPGRWQIYTDGGGTAEQGPISLRLTLVNDMYSQAMARSLHYHDFRGSSVAIDVESVLTSTGPFAEFSLYRDEGNSISFHAEDGDLIMRRQADGGYMDLATAAFDPDKDRHWRFRDDSEGSGHVLWETSPDGADWTARAEAPPSTFFSLEYVKVELVAHADYEPPATAESFAIRELTTEGPAGGWCPAASLREDFSNVIPGPLWLHNGGSSGGNALAIGGELVVSLPPNYEYDSSWKYATSRAYDLTNDAVTVELRAAADGDVTTFIELANGPDVAAIQVVPVDGSGSMDLELQAITRQGYDSPIVQGSKPYDLSQQRYLRIRHDGAGLRWEVSPDGHTWPAETSDPGSIALVAPAPLDVTEVEVRVGTRAPALTPKPGISRFDNLNVPHLL